MGYKTKIVERIVTEYEFEVLVSAYLPLPCALARALQIYGRMIFKDPD